MGEAGAACRSRLGMRVVLALGFAGAAGGVGQVLLRASAPHSPDPLPTYSLSACVQARAGQCGGGAGRAADGGGGGGAQGGLL